MNVCIFCVVFALPCVVAVLWCHVLARPVCWFVDTHKHEKGICPDVGVFLHMVFLGCFLGP